MAKRMLKNILAAFFGFIVVVYVAQWLMNLGRELPRMPATLEPVSGTRLAIFGATGTAGDGLLKAAISDPRVEEIHVVTRRLSPRIEAGIESGRVEATIHLDYMDYSAVRDVLERADAVFWAIGKSAFGMDEATYRRLHLDFPRRFIIEWMGARPGRDLSFHYISSNGAGPEARSMWAREKARAERALFETAGESGVRVIVYRPDYIAPTREQSSLGDELLYRFLAPINSAVRATDLGRAMLAVSAGGDRFRSGTIVENADIVGYSTVYRERGAAEEPL
jgi:nucleoside-diphosphate-sugar epimerase